MYFILNFFNFLLVKAIKVVWCRYFEEALDVLYFGAKGILHKKCALVFFGFG